jgi:multiple sugar transport system ATP-binding protein
MASFRVGDAFVSVKSAKDYRAEIGDIVHAAIPASACHLFDRGTGARLEFSDRRTTAGKGYAEGPS